MLFAECCDGRRNATPKRLFIAIIKPNEITHSHTHTTIPKGIKKKRRKRGKEASETYYVRYYWLPSLIQIHSVSAIATAATHTLNWNRIADTICSNGNGTLPNPWKKERERAKKYRITWDDWIVFRFWLLNVSISFFFCCWYSDERAHNKMRDIDDDGRAIRSQSWLFVSSNPNA